MDLSLYFSSFILGLIEGATEFLPVSSTGHLIIAAELLKFNQTSANVFEIFIQLGSILAIVVEYRKTLFKVASNALHDKTSKNFVLRLFIAFLPAAILGLLFHKAIKAYLFSPLYVSLALILGGIVMMAIEKRPLKINTKTTNDISMMQAFQIGCAQCLSLIPGVSRAAATIMGGMLTGLNRKTATEFSFYLAIPVIAAASLFDLLKNFQDLTLQDLPIFAIGFVTAFLSAYAVIKLFIRFVATHTFIVFAWYRIILGIIVFIYFSG
ncbi:undecaprenyl-diphosphate phosphatase [Candidatus Methylopumilus universalis]|jgi:undecaprenyl-diphosphatase|uniref:undecaprenyl-diphosphate phosphatase n=1 Tax=Candidatus Methylopumilus universalis TaxID=2588536 RepID=UPI0011224DCF|nr:undecaprenyl-diphosphate phosphatase [Candidatus Methylopumilus universalis]QDC89804.1 undecaprenyl-diphosphate phosphatase [Candidatus Methylopumilus universalis]QDC91104.1 undecaprenyl-diphosphate phosphatase [Candidatus Methylopumilus universalis]